MAATRLARLAASMGFTLTAGGRHWHAAHPSGGRAIVPYGRKISDRSARRIAANLRRAAQAQQTPTKGPA
jgi:hypothetical protein